MKMYGYEIIHDGRSYGFVLLYNSKKKTVDYMKKHGVDPKLCIEVPYPQFEKHDNPVY
jgi:hypothetical protein